MKRTTLIAVVLCALLLGTVGVGTVTAQEKTELPPEFKVMQFDVTWNEGAVVGTITVNLQQGTYVVNAHGLPPLEGAWLYCRGDG